MTDMDDIDNVAEQTSSKRERANSALNKVPDGKHKITLTGGEIKSFGTNNVKVVVKFAIPLGETEMVNGEKDYWIKGKDGVNQDRMNDLKADLAAFGADVDAWTVANMRPFSAELTKFLSIMPGLVIDGAKKTSEKADKEGNKYINVYFNGRAKDADGKLADARPASLDAAWIADAIASMASKPPF